MGNAGETRAGAMFPVADIDRVQEAFPAGVMGLMPPYADIPAEFKHGRTWGNRLFNDMFYRGLIELNLVPKDGVDAAKAWRHIRTISGSFEPKHQHKEAAVAYLMGQWFDEATTWEPGTTSPVSPAVVTEDDSTGCAT